VEIKIIFSLIKIRKRGVVFVQLLGPQKFLIHTLSIKDDLIFYPPLKKENKFSDFSDSQSTQKSPLFSPLSISSDYSCSAALFISSHSPTLDLVEGLFFWIL